MLRKVIIFTCLSSMFLILQAAVTDYEIEERGEEFALKLNNKGTRALATLLKAKQELTSDHQGLNGLIVETQRQFKDDERNFSMLYKNLRRSVAKQIEDMLVRKILEAKYTLEETYNNVTQKYNSIMDKYRQKDVTTVS